MREHFHTERYIFPVGYEVTRCVARYLSQSPMIDINVACAGATFPPSTPTQRLCTTAKSSTVEMARSSRSQQPLPPTSLSSPGLLRARGPSSCGQRITSAIVRNRTRSQVPTSLASGRTRSSTSFRSCRTRINSRTTCGSTSSKEGERLSRFLSAVPLLPFHHLRCLCASRGVLDIVSWRRGAGGRAIRSLMPSSTPLLV